MDAGATDRPGGTARGRRRGYGLADRLRYRTDRILASSIWVQLAALGLAVALVVLVGGALYVLVEAETLVTAGPFWSAFARVLDGGTMGPDEGLWVRTVSGLVTVGGLFVFGILINVVQNYSQDRLDQLKRGNGPVFEKDFDLVLGWNDRVPAIVEELVASGGKRRPTIVLMSGRPAEDVEADLENRLKARGLLKRVRLVCRTGDPIDAEDLARLHFGRARSIIVLTDDFGTDDRDTADIRAIKVLLAVTKHPDPRMRVRPDASLVVEIDGRHHGPLATAVAGERARIVKSREVIGRLVAHTACQEGLYKAYLRLLDVQIEGSELRILDPLDALVGVRFGDAFLRLQGAIPVGVDPDDGPLVLNPPADSLIARGDRLVVVSGCGDVPLADPPCPDPGVPEAPGGSASAGPVRFLVLGYSASLPLLLAEMDGQVAAGSTVTVLAPDPDRSRAADVAACAEPLHNLQVDFRAGDPSERDELERLAPAGFQSVVVLADDTLGPEAADARTLVVLLQLRGLSRAGRDGPPVTAEILEERNRHLVESESVRDVVVSNRLTSLVMAQFARQKDLGAAWAELLHAGGNNLFLRPFSAYLPAGRHRFAEVMRAAQRRGEIALGCRQPADAPSGSAGAAIHLNPSPSQEFDLLRREGQGDDRVLVLGRARAAGPEPR